MNTPIVVILSGPEKTRAKAELALEKARLTIIPSKEWPICRESYRAEHWSHLTQLPSGQPPDEDHGFVAVLAETEAAFHAAVRAVEKAKWVLRIHHELPERPKPREDPITMLLQRMDDQERRIAELTRKLGGQPSIGGAGFETGAGEFMTSSAVGFYTAAQMRRSTFLWAARAGTTVGSAVANSPGAIAGGIFSATDMQITAATSGLVVYTSTGECLIPGQEASSQGGYHGFLSAQNSTTLTANSSNPWVYAIVVTSADPQYTTPSGGTPGYVTIQAVAGTPTAGATIENLSGAPTIPLSSLLLGYVCVPAAATSLTDAEMVNLAAVVTPQSVSCSVGSAAGAPTSGYFLEGYTHLDSKGVLYVCTAAGSPGTWACPPGQRLAPPTVNSGTHTYTLTTTFGAVDTTNMTVGPFVCPASGAVTVRLQAQLEAPSDGSLQIWGLVLHNTSTQVGNSQCVFDGAPLSSIGTVVMTQGLDFEITGLTPGTSYQFDWAAYGATSIVTGDATGDGQPGPGSMKVFAA